MKKGLGFFFLKNTIVLCNIFSELIKNCEEVMGQVLSLRLEGGGGELVKRHLDHFLLG